MNINLSISAAPGITTNSLVIALYESTAPATVAATKVLSAPHINPVNVSFTNLRMAIYIVKIFESPDGTPSGVLRHNFEYNPSFGGANVRADEVLIVDQTTGLVSGTTSYDNSSYANWQYTLERRGVGSLIDYAKSTLNADYTVKDTGGFNLVQDNDVFGAGEIFVVHFLPQLIETESQISQTAGILWGGEKDITVDTTLGASDMGKYCLIQGTSPIINITLPSGNAVVDGTMIAFLSEGGQHKVANVLPNGSDQIKWLGDTWTNSDPFSIHQSEEVWFLYYGNSWRVAQADGGWKQVGELVYTYKKDQINAIQADGGTYNRAYYPRLWRYVKKFLESTLLVDASVWAFTQQSPINSNPYKFYPNVTKYSSGDGYNTFQTPLLMKSFDNNGNIKSGGYLRAVSGANADKVGTQKKDAVGNFYFESSLKTGDSFNNHPYPPTAAGKGLLANTPVDIPLQFYVAGADPNDKTPNGETRPFSANAYLLIKI